MTMTVASEEIGLPAALPDRARLLHIGLMKTGTTALQRAASARRWMLLEHGVRYPGTRYNHRQAALCLMNRGPHGPGVARPDDDWEALRREIESDRARRIWVSNEFICGSDEPVARRFLADLGPRIHVVITLRSVGSVLPSLWQQYVKTGTTHDFPAWLDIVLADPPRPSELPPHYARHNQGEVVSRWARLAGPENVTVVIGDKSQPQRVQHAFEGMLGLPAGTLRLPQDTGYHTNRSLTAEEAALFLRVNQILPPGQMSHAELSRILRGGAIKRVLDEATLTENAGALTLPTWAAARACEIGRRYAEVIQSSRVRVLGDLSELSRCSHPEEAVPASSSVSVDTAAQAIVGAMSAALYRGSHFGRPVPPVAADSGPTPTAVRPPLLTRAVRRVQRHYRAAHRRPTS